MYSKPHILFGAQASNSSNTNAEKWYNPNHSITQYPNTSHIDASLPLPSPLCSQGEGSDEQTDYFHGVFDYLNQMLMEEEDLENKPCMLADCLALQAVQQSFYDVLVDKHLPFNYKCFSHDTSHILPWSHPSHIDASLPLPSPLCSQGEGSDEQTDYFHGVFDYLNQMLMEEEEDLENKPCMLADCSALQAVQQSFYDVLVDKHLPFNYTCFSHDSSHESSCSITSSLCLGSNASIQQNSSTPLSYYVEPDIRLEFEPFLPIYSLVNSGIHPSFDPIGFTKFLCSVPLSNSPFQVLGSSTLCREQGEYTHFLPSYSCMNYGMVPNVDISPSRSSGKRNIYEECQSNNKHLACYSDDSVQIEMYDKVLLSRCMNPQWQDETEATSSFNEDKPKLHTKGKKSGRAKGGKNTNKKEIVDLRSLLLQCSKAVSNNDIREAEELLKEIRKHSSPHGDSIERLAHYFCNAIDARLEGTGTSIYRSFSTSNISAAQILKSYNAYIKACPFHRMSNIFANKSIAKLAKGREKLHIIDLGILYGFQWPCIIQALSLAPGGPPKLRITGIDLPQPGFRPAQRVEETGCRLEKYCERFNVPFEYKVIAKKWETIKIEDLEIDRDEVLVVNSIYRLRCVPDETVGETKARDKVLNLIKKLNPDMFVFGVLNGKYNVPFFQSRFREAVSYFSTLFDMFEATRPLEDKDRLLFEQEVFGRDIMNVIACEGVSRVERPEMYKKWQVRIVKAGFRQMPLCEEIVKEVRKKVKLDYHKDFVVDEDCKWLLQGWKGRILYALSLWMPMEE